MTARDKDDHFGFLCPHCKKPVVANVMGSAVTKRVRYKAPAESGWGAEETKIRDAERAVLVKCSDCFQPVLMDQTYRFGWETSRIMWPPPVREISEHVPEAIRKTFEEARGCYQHSYYRAAVVMVRRSLEAVCSDQGSTKKTLSTMLTDLEARGKLDKRLTEWANELRTLGNSGAHFTPDDVTREDAGDAIAFTEALLDYLYVLSAQFDAFKKRREAGDINAVTDVVPAQNDTDPPQNGTAAERNVTSDAATVAATNGWPDDEPPF